MMKLPMLYTTQPLLIYIHTHVFADISEKEKITLDILSHRDTVKQSFQDLLMGRIH